MILCPAVDIRGGQAVRLTQGDYARERVYDADPVDAARRWAADGARRLHVVDLDGAREGRPINLQHVRRIADAVGVPLQVGGGMRCIDDVRNALAVGAKRVVLGTAALTDASFLETVIAQIGDRALVSVDVRDDLVTTAGWTSGTGVRAEDALTRLQDLGVESFVFTNVAVDGTLAGPQLDQVARVADTVRGTLLYAGGIGSLDDLRALAGLRKASLAGVIVGKALYEGRFSLAEAQAILDAQDRSATV